MIVHSLTAGPFATNVYVLECPNTNEAVVIDPAMQSFKWIKSQSVDYKKILLTHSHLDHIADLAKVKKELNLPIFVHELDAENVRNPGHDGVPLGFLIASAEPDGYFKEGDVIKFGECELEVIETPGHTPGGVCFYNRDAGILISGDTLFQGSIGNLSFSTCEPDKMWISLDKLAKLPPETKVYPGHGPSTTIGKESWLPQARQIFGY